MGGGTPGKKVKISFGRAYFEVLITFATWELLLCEEVSVPAPLARL
jgi:hypothetical protein